MMETDLLSAAIVKVREKVVAHTTPTGVNVPSEPYTQIFPTLEVWDSDRVDPDTQEKAKFIYDHLKENHEEKLTEIFNRIGVTAPLERKLDRVYRYCRLRNEADKIRSRYEQLEKDINALSRN